MINSVRSATLLYILACTFYAYGSKTWKPAACRLPSKTGPCKASIEAWYYDWGKGKCKSFTYGGCDGNGNNFETQKQCEKRCGRNYNRKHDKCLLWRPEEKSCGNKSVIATRWFFEENKSSCKQKIFPTCKQDPKGFGTCSQCVATCRHHMKTLQACEDAANPK
uniref:Putative bilaris n=1 Tax=Rhipicephalus pulchellus TaxID=72859 RepID=L7LTW7_RHIPC